MSNIDEKISEVKKRIAEVKKRWPFHSPKPVMFEELENLEVELEELKRLKKSQSCPSDYS